MKLKPSPVPRVCALVSSALSDLLQFGACQKVSKRFSHCESRELLEAQITVEAHNESSVALWEIRGYLGGGGGGNPMGLRLKSPGEFLDS